MSTIIEHKRTVGVQPSPEFAKKHLATHGLNVGLICGHGCKYCSTPSLLRRHPIFTALNISSSSILDQGISIVDPWTPKRILKSVHKLQPTDTVMLSTITDAWSPEAQQYGLGRSCLEALLFHSNCKVRILTKNAAVQNEYDLLSQYPDRVELSLSLTAPVAKEQMLKIIEPNTSSISDRLSALKEAHDLGIPIYGMICPVIPGFIDDANEFSELLNNILPLNPTTIWTEPINKRGNNLNNCINALYQAGEIEAANKLETIRKENNYESYLDNFIKMVTDVSIQYNCLDKLKILVYRDGSEFYGNDSAVIWLK